MEQRKQSHASLITFLVLLAAIFVGSVKMVAPYLLSVLMGGILALLSYPLYRKLRDRNHGAKLSSTLVTVGILLLVIGPISAFVALTVKQGITLGEYLSSRNDFSFQSIMQRLSHWKLLSPFVDSTAALERQIRSGIQNVGKSMSGAVLGAAASLPALLLQLVLALIACFFFLIDGKRFIGWTANKLPLDTDVRVRLMDSFRNTAISVIWATLTAAAAQATVMAIAYLTLGVPAAFLAAGATFIFAWIPMVGSFPVGAVGTIYLISQHSYIKAGIMVGFALLTGVVDNFVRPLVLKGRNSMHPLVGLVAIFGGIQLFGIVGVFVGPILAAILISLLEVWPLVALRSDLEFSGMQKAYVESEKSKDQPKQDLKKASGA